MSKALLVPLVVLTLAVQATGTFGGAYFCRMLAERLVICCCPEEEAPAGPELAERACCDVLQAQGPATPAQEAGAGTAGAPARSPSVAVAPPSPLRIALSGVVVAAAFPRSSGPPGRGPVFLSLKQLLR